MYLVQKEVGKGWVLVRYVLGHFSFGYATIFTSDKNVRIAKTTSRVFLGAK